MHDGRSCMRRILFINEDQAGRMRFSYRLLTEAFFGASTFCDGSDYSRVYIQMTGPYLSSRNGRSLTGAHPENAPSAATQIHLMAVLMSGNPISTGATCEPLNKARNYIGSVSSVAQT